MMIIMHTDIGELDQIKKIIISLQSFEKSFEDQFNLNVVSTT